MRLSVYGAIADVVAIAFWSVVSLTTEGIFWRSLALVLVVFAAMRLALDIQDTRRARKEHA